MDELPNYLLATPEMYGVKQQSLEIPQSADIVISLIDACSDKLAELDPATSNVCAVLKDDVKCDAVQWYGDKDTGGIQYLGDGCYNVVIKHVVAATLPTGIYYLAVFYDNLVNNTVRREILYEQTLSIRPTAAAENAGNSNAKTVATSCN